MLFLGRTKKSYEQVQAWSQVLKFANSHHAPLKFCGTIIVMPVLDGMFSFRPFQALLLSLLEEKVPKHLWRRVVPICSGTNQYDWIKRNYGMPEEDVRIVVSRGISKELSETIYIIGGPTQSNLELLTHFLKESQSVFAATASVEK